MAKILVVDDEAVNRELIAAYLEGSGHELIEASSGDEALAIASAKLPDLVLLDVIMPGMNGFEVARRLNELAAEQYLPIVLLTALSDHTSRVVGLRTGADEYLCKPVDQFELSARIRTLLALRDKELALL